MKRGMTRGIFSSLRRPISGYAFEVPVEGGGMGRVTRKDGRELIPPCKGGHVMCVFPQHLSLLESSARSLENGNGAPKNISV